LLLAQRQGLVQAQFAIFVAVIADQEDGAGGDLVIDARTALGGGLALGRVETSRDYDSLLSW
jgi:hypothetical protein